MRSRLKRSSIADFDASEASSRVPFGVVLFEMIVSWRDHSRSLLAGPGRANAPNLADAVAVDLEEFKDALAEDV